MRPRRESGAWPARPRRRSGAGLASARPVPRARAAGTPRGPGRSAGAFGPAFPGTGARRRSLRNSSYTSGNSWLAACGSPRSMAPSIPVTSLITREAKAPHDSLQVPSRKTTPAVAATLFLGRTPTAGVVYCDGTANPRASDRRTRGGADALRAAVVFVPRRRGPGSVRPTRVSAEPSREHRRLVAPRRAQRRRQRVTFGVPAPAPRSAAAARRPAWFVSVDGAALDADTVTAALEGLPVEARETVVAHLWGGLTFEQVGELTGVSSSTAHRRYLQALAALRERLRVPCPRKN